MKRTETDKSKLINSIFKLLKGRKKGFTFKEVCDKLNIKDAEGKKEVAKTLNNFFPSRLVPMHYSEGKVKINRWVRKYNMDKKYRMQRAIVGNATDPNMVKLPDEAIGITIIVKDKIEFVYYLVQV